MNSARGLISSATDDTTSSWINTSRLMGEFVPIALIERIVCGCPSSLTVKSTGRNSDSGCTRSLTRIVTGIVTGRAVIADDPSDWALGFSLVANETATQKTAVMQDL